MLTQRILFVIASLALAALSVASPAAGASTDANGQRPGRYILPGNAVFPEGVAYQQSTGYYYVSSTTDGTIFRGTLDEETAGVFLPGGTDGRTTAVGLATDKTRLFVAGGQTGRVWVYDTASGALLGTFSNNKTATFVNDVAVTRTGDAYFTDSLDPTIYRMTTNSQGRPVFEAWLDLRGTPIQYTQGFNLNGIEVSNNDRYLVTVQSNTGKLYRIDIATREITQIDLGGVTVTSGDGLLLRGRTLYVVRNSLAQIAEIRLSGDMTGGELVSTSTDPSFRFPTTVTIAKGRLLVVNSQFNKRGPGLQPELPFTLSSVGVP